MRYLLALLISTILVSCHFGFGEKVNGNGRIKTEERQAQAFKRVDVSGEITVHVKQDAATGVKLETDENLLPYIEVFVSGSKLVIRSKEGYNLDPSKEIVAYISAPEFNSIDVSGSCDIIGDNTLSGDKDLDMSVSGSGSIKMDVDLKEVKTHVSGSGSIILKGHADQFDASISGTGDIKCFDLATDNTNLDLSGAATAEVNADKQLDVDVSGSGDVKYKGNANVKQSISGSGSVTKVGS